LFSLRTRSLCLGLAFVAFVNRSDGLGDFCASPVEGGLKLRMRLDELKQDAWELRVNFFRSSGQG
jgi:hypothetical protein